MLGIQPILQLNFYKLIWHPPWKIPHQQLKYHNDMSALKLNPNKIIKILKALIPIPTRKLHRRHHPPSLSHPPSSSHHLNPCFQAHPHHRRPPTQVYSFSFYWKNKITKYQDLFNIHEHFLMGEQRRRKKKENNSHIFDGLRSIHS